MLLTAQSAAAQVTTAELLKTCEQNTTVFGRVNGELKKVGERLDGYCRGYLDGHISALKGKVCLEVGSDAHFVVSLLKKYVDDDPKSKTLDAGAALSDALLRAYKCK
jgi:hypothetical protein